MIYFIFSDYVSTFQIYVLSITVFLEIKEETKHFKQIPMNLKTGMPVETPPPPPLLKS